jgi:hypothetical protein
MRIRTFWLAVTLAGAASAAGQEPADALAPGQRVFQLELEPLFVPGYEPARELRLALWDSPMSRLELAVSREQWSLRNPGPLGSVIPFQTNQGPMRLKLDSGAQPLVLGPWSPAWDRLTWQEKVAASAQAGFLAWGLIEILRHVD